MRRLRWFGQIAVLMLVLGWTSLEVVAQGYHPMVHMSVTLPNGTVTEATAAESALAKVKVGDREYGLRPTMMDDTGARIVVTIFDLGGPTEPIREVGAVEVKVGGGPVAVKSPSMKITATEIKK